MRREVDPDELAVQAELAQSLHRLSEYPEWKDLYFVMEGRREAHMRKLAKRMERGSPIPHEEQLRHIGFWEGVFAVLKTPDKVERQLETMLARAQQEGVK